MKCKKARYFAALKMDGVLTQREYRFLHAHLAQCDQCRLYKARLLQATAILDEDAAAVAAQAELSTGFSARLHSALDQESVITPYRLPAGIQRLLARAEAAPRFSSLGIIRALVSVAAAAAAVICLSALLSSTPARVQRECRFGHLASFTVEPAQDGRVYAAAVEQTSVGRLTQREIYLR